jgi:hypothetical protein
MALKQKVLECWRRMLKVKLKDRIMKNFQRAKEETLLLNL